MFWTKVDLVLPSDALPFAHRCLVISLSRNRVALAVEIPSCWLPFDFEPARALLWSAASPAELEDPSRYLWDHPPPMPGELWADFVNRSRPPSWSWLEVLAARGPLTMHCISAAFESVFEESRVLRGRDDRLPFSQVCSHSGFSEIGDRLSLDQSAPNFSGRSFLVGLPPRKRLRSFQASLENRGGTALPDLQHVRFPGHLLLVESLRSQLASCQKSWKSVRSGLLCWGEFMRIFRPRSPHVPITEELFRMFSSVFRCGGTLAQYVSHLRFVSRLSSTPFLVGSDVTSSLLRGLRKVSETHRAPVLTRRQVIGLVRWLIRESRVDLARFVVVAFHFMCRVQSELSPLQYDGSSGHAGAWHSRLSLGRSSCIITYRCRKNEQSGAAVKRTCICSDSPHLLCGVCSLAAQVRASDSRRRPLQPIFLSVNLRGDLAFINQYVSSAGLPALSWHSFRRSAAQDMLARGSTIAQIVRAGGWKSGAFLQYLSRRDVDDRAHLDLVQLASDQD